MSIAIYSGGTALPSPTELTTEEEIIWSADTGRGEDGTMLGDVIAQKRKFRIVWGVLTAAEYEALRTRLPAGFFTFRMALGGVSSTVTGYRGALTGEVLGRYGGTVYYKNASVDVIQR